MNALALRRAERPAPFRPWSLRLAQPTIDLAASILSSRPFLGFETWARGAVTRRSLSSVIQRYQVQGQTRGRQDHVVLAPDASLIVSDLDHVPDCPYTLTSTLPLFFAQFRVAGTVTMSGDGRSLTVDHRVCLFSRFAPGDERQVHVAEGAWRAVALVCSEAALRRWGLAESALALLSGGAVTAIPMPRAASEAIRDLLECRYDGDLRRPFVEAKLLEALCGVLGAAAQSRAAPSTTFSPSELRRVTQAAELIQSSFDEPLTLQRVARRVGLNRSRLAAGFKAVFETTFYERLREVRMIEARRLLDRGGAVSMAAAAVGYESACSFSRAFKARYGVAPSERLAAARLSLRHRLHA
ncbi:helix-turn-helix transcriptional regulator [Caulobacter soli]|uniref:helix-turn-helix transcriptional regulator n=1 Tax=Caulobacter soli TaxID=2708539 RepID=UPI0013E9B101|nr:AraC family transcriptional regulator [Caulobacter soli]